MNKFTTYHQFKEYYTFKLKDGFDVGYITLSNGDKVLYTKTYKEIKGFKIPLFHKITIVGLPCYEDKNLEKELMTKIEKMVRNPFCIKAQIFAKPLHNYANYLFNGVEYTYILNLSNIKTEDEYMALLKSKARTSVRKSLKQNLTLKRLETLDELQIYLDIRNENRINNGLSLLKIEHFKNALETLGKVKRYYVVMYDDIPLVGQIVSVGDNIYTLEGVCTSKKAYELKLYANDFMQYNIVKMAIEEGVDYIDWGGAKPYSKDPKMQAIDRFKAKWGGALVEFPVYVKGYEL